MDALGSGNGVRIVCKGAPEALAPLLSEVPPGYLSAYSTLSATGARVLALAYRVLSAGTSVAHVRSWSRQEAEQGLTFVGFLVLSSPLKTDSKRTVRELQLSRHRVVMITGDAPLTAVAVAHQVGILKPVSADADALSAPPASAPEAPAAAAHVVLVLEADSVAQSPSLRWRVVHMHHASDAKRSEALDAAVVAIDAAAREHSASGRGTDNGVFLPAVRPFFLPGPSSDNNCGGDFASAPLCITGAAMQELIVAGELTALDELCDRAAVFARVNPDHKERIVVSINSRLSATGSRHLTLMCGDGTNDVSALKQAHVGVSIISNPALEQRIDALRLKQQHAQRKRVQDQVDKLVATGHFTKDAAEKYLRVNEVVDATADDELSALLQAERQPPSVQPPEPAPTAALAPSAGPPRKATLQEELSRRMAELERESGGDIGGPAMVALGDASIASPFTSKQPSPSACLDILRQGRCTLVTTLQMYKILAINSLVLSYTLSVLYLNGVKSGDYQATASGMSVAAFFLFISWAKPLRRLSSKRPHTSVFHRSLMLSIMGQFLIHLATIAYAVSLVTPYAHVDAALAEAAKRVAILNPAPLQVVSDPSAWGDDSAVPTEDLTASQATLAMHAILSGQSVDDVVALVLPSGASALAEGGLSSPSESHGELRNPTDVDASDEKVKGQSTTHAARTSVEKKEEDVIDDEFDDIPSLDPSNEVGHMAIPKLSDGIAIPKLGDALSAATSSPPKPTLLEDVKFHPNIINTVVFLVSTTMQACTFLVNYEGAPFMEPLTLYSGMVLLTLATYAASVLGALGLSHELSNALQLIELPTPALRYSVAAIIVVNGVACVGLERLIRWAVDR